MRKAGETVEKADLPALLEPSHGRTGEAEAEQRERGEFGNRCGLHQIQRYVVEPAVFAALRPLLAVLPFRLAQ